ncbi:MAG: glycosyltransferase family 2 protein [Actinomycetota bacterium]|nr:glycosyltransferase family 2 protein [Actinomycetota bacterium]
MSGAARVAGVLALGLSLVALELWLRGETDVDTQVKGQLVAFALFLPLAVLCWRGLGVGLLGVGLVLALAACMRVAAFEPGTAPPLSNDLNRYAWDARVDVHGINPYRYAPTDRRLTPLRDREIWRGINLPHWKTIYPPGAEGSFLLARRIFGGGLRATTWLFLAAEALTAALLLLVLARDSLPLERVGIYALHPLAVSEIAANGHVDALVATALAALLALWQARRFALAGVAVAAAALVKLGPMLLVVGLARRGRERFALVALGVVVLAYLPFLSVGTAVFGSLWRLNERLHFGSLAPPLGTLVGWPAAQILLGLTLGVVLVSVAVREHDTVTQVARSGLLVLGTLLLVQNYLQPWYGLALLPLLALAPAPGWLWLSGALPLLYLYNAGELPVWVRPVMFGPLLGAALVALARRRRPRTCELPALAPEPRVALVVPVLDEEEALPALLREVPARVVDEVIVVDGGSRDRTPALARAAGASLISEPRRGYGRACAAGAAATDAEIIVFMDGDGSDDPAELFRVLEPLLAGRAALSLGARADLEAGALLPHQRLGNAVVVGLLRLVYGIRLNDVPPMRAIRREALEGLSLSEMTYGWPTEMIVKAARAGLPISEVPVHWRARRGGSSKIAGRAWPSARAGALMLAVVVRHA